MSARYIAMTVLRRNLETGDWWLQHNVAHPNGGFTDYGDPELIAANSLGRKKIAKLILESLAACQSRRLDESRGDSKRNLDNIQYRTVYITERDDGILEICAGQQRDGGSEAPVVAVVNRDEAQPRLLTLIEEAFERAG